MDPRLSSPFTGCRSEAPWLWAAFGQNRFRKEFTSSWARLAGARTCLRWGHCGCSICVALKRGLLLGVLLRALDRTSTNERVSIVKGEVGRKPMCEKRAGVIHVMDGVLWVDVTAGAESAPPVPLCPPPSPSVPLRPLCASATVASGGRDSHCDAGLRGRPDRQRLPRVAGRHVSVLSPHAAGVTILAWWEVETVVVAVTASHCDVWY